MKKDLRKIAIIGSGATGLHHAIIERLKNDGVQIIDTAETTDYTEALKQYERPDPIVMKLTAPKNFDMPFQEPISRKERRKQQRKNK